MIESLSLIDAVMPDVVESRKQAAQKAHQIKTEPANTNGEDATHTISKCKHCALSVRGIGELKPALLRTKKI